MAGQAHHRATRADALTATGLDVEAVTTIRAARAVAGTGVACLVLDRWAPDGDALDLVDRLYRDDRAPRMVVIGGEGSTGERVESLTAGADDVVPPRVSAAELAARVRRLIAAPVSAAPLPATAPIRVGRLEIDQDRRHVCIDGREVRLSPIQYQILVELAGGSGRIVPGSVLRARCWDAHAEDSPYALRSQMARLRRTLRGVLEIRCVRGQGYVAEPEG